LSVSRGRRNLTQHTVDAVTIFNSIRRVDVNIAGVYRTPEKIISSLVHHGCPLAFSRRSEKSSDESDDLFIFVVLWWQQLFVAGAKIPFTLSMKVFIGASALLRIRTSQQTRSSNTAVAGNEEPPR
jgi:hypothetical protein